MKNRLIASIIEEFQHIQPMSIIAKGTNLSGKTAARIFNHVEYAKPDLPEVISIDGFKSNGGGEKFKGSQKEKFFDVLPNRKAETLYGYFSTFESRKDIRYVVMDMSSPFKAIVKACLPKGIIVADRFHVIGQVCWAMENVHKEEQKKFCSNKRRGVRHNRKLLLRHEEDLSENQIQKVDIMLQTSEHLSRAYGALQDFYRSMECTASGAGS